MRRIHPTDLRFAIFDFHLKLVHGNGNLTTLVPKLLQDYRGFLNYLNHRGWKTHNVDRNNRLNDWGVFEVKQALLWLWS